MNSLLSIFYIVLTRSLCVWQLQYQWFLGTSLSQLISGFLLPLVLPPPWHILTAGVSQGTCCHPAPASASSFLASLPITILCLPHLFCLWHCNPSPILKTFLPTLTFLIFLLVLPLSLPPSFLKPWVSQELVFGLIPTPTLTPKMHIYFHSFHPRWMTPSAISHSVSLPVCGILRHLNKVSKRRQSQAGGHCERFCQHFWNLYLE